MAKKKGRKKKHTYHSKKQVRWAFANKKSFARRWAHEAKVKKGKKVWYRRLPESKHSGKKGKRRK